MVDKRAQMQGKKYPSERCFPKVYSQAYKVDIDDLIAELKVNKADLKTMRAYCHLELHYNEDLPSHVLVRVICDAYD